MATEDIFKDIPRVSAKTRLDIELAHILRRRGSSVDQARGNAQALLDGIKAEYCEAMSVLLGPDIAERRRTTDPEKARFQLIHDAFRRAFAAGRASILPDFPSLPQENRIVRVLSERELHFARGINDHQGARCNDLPSRSQDVLDSVYYVGLISVLPAETKIDWILGPGDSCPNCLRLVSDGPYGVPGNAFGLRPLSIVPRSRSIECGLGCTCRLEFHILGFGDIDRPTRLRGSIRDKDGRDKSLDNVEPESRLATIIRELDRIQAARAYWRQRVAAASDDKQEREAAKLVARLQRELMTRQEELAVDYRPNVRVADYLEPIERLLAQGFSTIEVGSLSVGDTVARIDGLTVDVGTVVSNASSPTGLAIDTSNGNARSIAIEHEAGATTVVMLRRNKEVHPK